MSLYGAFEWAIIGGACSWALWHTATKVLKLRFSRRGVSVASSGACGSGSSSCGQCGSAGSSGHCSSSAPPTSTLRGISVVSAPVAPSTTHRSE